MAAPTVDDLRNLVGKQETVQYDDSTLETQMSAALEIVTAMASSYTRGQGFTDGEPNEQIRAVILTASARLLADPSQIAGEKTMGPFTMTYRAGFDGWSTAERYVLDRYRVRAM